MIHGKKVSNFIFSFAPTKLHNFPLCQVSLVLPWSPLGPTQNPFSTPTFIVCVFVPRLSQQSFVTQFKLFFDHQKKKERKKEKRWYLYQYPLFRTLRVNIDKNKTQYKQWHPSELCHVNIAKTKNTIWTNHHCDWWIKDHQFSLLSFWERPLILCGVVDPKVSCNLRVTYFIQSSVYKLIQSCLVGCSKSIFTHTRAFGLATIFLPSKIT